MSGMGHSRPMHSVPVPINVRCHSHSDIIVGRSEVTRRARKKLTHRSKLGGSEAGKPARAPASLRSHQAVDA